MSTFPIIIDSLWKLIANKETGSHGKKAARRGEVSPFLNENGAVILSGLEDFGSCANLKNAEECRVSGD